MKKLKDKNLAFFFFFKNYIYIPTLILVFHIKGKKTKLLRFLRKKKKKNEEVGCERESRKKKRRMGEAVLYSYI